jgi:hypothetical protein
VLDWKVEHRSVTGATFGFAKGVTAERRQVDPICYTAFAVDRFHYAGSKYTCFKIFLY